MLMDPCNPTRQPIILRDCSRSLKISHAIPCDNLSEPEFYGDLVYKFKKIRGMTDFSDQFRKIIMRYKLI